MEQEYKYMVATKCMTYNQAAYIEETLRGFAIQETKFPAVYIVIDDASTDGEQEVLTNWASKQLVLNPDSDTWKILPYGKLVEAQHRQNPNALFVILLLFENHYQKRVSQKKLEYIREWTSRSKYIAQCEGDDYWTDSHKLEIQVGFLENNPDFVECSHRFWIKDERLGRDEDLVNYPGHDNLEFAFQYGVKGFVFDSSNYWQYWYSQPLTVVVRNGGFYDDIPRSKYRYYRDIIEHYYIVKQGKGMLLDRYMGVYRKNDGGIYASKKLIENAYITNNNLRTIFEVERDENVIPVLHNNVITLWRYAMSHLKIKEACKILKQHYKLLPKSEKLPFTKQLMVEPFMILKRKIKGNK